MSGVVVDTSVWIDFLAGRAASRLEEALEAGTVVLPPVAVAELLSGARNSRDRRAILDILTHLPVHPTPRQHWVAVGDLRAALIKRGITVSTPDAHVAQCALELDALLLSRDAVFSSIAGHSPLRLAS